MVLKWYFVCLLVFVGVLIIPYSTIANGNLNRISKFISKEFDVEKSEIEFEEWDFTCKNEDEKEEYYSLVISNKIKGFLVLTKAKGRYDYFDFFILFNPDFTVCLASVTSYFSDHGGEITSKKWLSQFEGYKGGDLVYGRDIDAIAGATISAGSITSKVKMITNQIRNCNIEIEFGYSDSK